MGWYNCHLYEFELGGLHIGMPYEDFYDEIVDSSKIKVNKYLNRKGDKILYNYDFGDGWQHLVSVEKIEPQLKTEYYPTCIKGKVNCPPEDCGGIWGYYEVPETIKNKNHPDDEDMLEWLGGNYNPEAFEIEDINQRLKKYH